MIMAPQRLFAELPANIPACVMMMRQVLVRLLCIQWIKYKHVECLTNTSECIIAHYSNLGLMSQIMPHTMAYNLVQFVSHNTSKLFNNCNPSVLIQKSLCHPKDYLPNFRQIPVKI
jgi:hypothetical protein